MENYLQLLHDILWGNVVLTECAYKNSKGVVKLWIGIMSIIRLRETTSVKN